MPRHFKTSGTQEWPQSTSEKSPKSHRRRWVWVVPLVLLVLLGVAYGAGVYVFGSVFLPGTTLDGTDVSLQRVADVAAQKDATYDGYEVAVSGDGLSLALTASDIDLSFDGEAFATSAHDQTNPWAWPLEITRTRELTATTDAGASFDRDKLVALIQPVIDESAATAETLGSGGLLYDAEQARFTLDERVVASHLDIDAVVERLSLAFAERETSVELGDECLKGESSLTDAVAQANAYVGATQTLTLGGQHAYDLDASLISSWITIGDDLTVTLDTQAIADFCHGELTDLLDTRGKERTYTRPDGVTKTVSDTNPHYSASVYGWVIDGDACAEQIAAAIQAGQPGSLDLTCIQTAAQVNPGGQDWPDRYIDVDLTAQHATFYDGGTVIWSADITSGQPSLDQETPTGVWTITNRKSRATDGDINLRGPIDPATGEPEWDSHVDFWAGVVGNLVGFHNAPWQSVFGGNIYTYSGSHGCIRLSYANAQALYNVVQVGDVVVVHK